MKKRISKKERYEKLRAACEPFRTAKTETIHTLAGIGRKHKLLRYPIMMALVVFIFIYNVILYGCLQLKVREKFARCVALVMTLVLVFTGVNVTAFATTEKADDRAQGKGVITAFSGLDESVAEQSLSVGAEESEINFPNTLTVTLETESREEQAESTVSEGNAVATPPGESTVSEGNAVSVAELDETETSIDVMETSIDVTWCLNTAAGMSKTFDSSKAGSCYVYVPVIPDEYTVAEGVSLPQITVTVQSNTEDETATAAEKILEEILRNYFEGLGDDEIYDAIIGMDEETRLLLTGDYEELLAALTQQDESNERLQELMGEIFCGITDTAENVPIRLPVLYQINATALETSDAIPLRRISGVGNAFVYHSFQETKTFTAGETYAFLNGIYQYDDAVSSLGSGAILKATDTSNGSSGYIRRKYGSSAEVKVYVDVVTNGRDFDGCVIGGLYEVPNSGTPTEYRYFCGFGGARNCGPYYAYNYVKESLTYDDVSASLNDIEKQGSEKPEDYTVRITYNGDQSKTLDAGSYTVQIPDSASDEVIIVVSDSEGNSITARFQCPLVVRYDGNAKNVSNVPSIQSVWNGESCTISSQTPTRDGYEIVNWKEADTGTFYSAGQSISLTNSLRLLAQWKDVKAPEVGYTPIQIMTRTSDDDVKNAVKAALTITDNEPVEECTVEVTLSASFASTVGNKNVTVKVTDKAGNSTTKECAVNVTSFVDISTPVFTESTKNLTSILRNPGTDTITESGFVWGVMNAPSLTVNNGRVKTQAAVSRVDDEISVTADNLQKGVTYYARAYIIAGGVTYYSEEISFGLGLPAYGTFTVTNNGSNTFTVTRSGGSEGTQTVYYRTVNGSAVGGTHFTHQAGTLTFNEGETTKTITVTEKGANTAYSGQPATAYTNADRTYSLELYRVTGGGSLGSQTSAARTMTKGSSYTVDRSIYTDWVLGYSDSTEHKITDAGYDKNYSFSFTTAWPQKSDYLSATATDYQFYFVLECKEDNDGYQYMRVLNGNGNAQADKWEIKSGQPGTSWRSGAYFPSSTATGSMTDIISQNWSCTGSMSWVKSASREYFNLATSTPGEITVGFDAGGSGDDDWRWKNLEQYFRPGDTKEPQLVAVAPMAGGLYKAGDSFTVSLIFDEIVDSTNSGALSNVTLNTSWGTAAYAGGADTNVLYFTGKVASNASETLSVNGFTNTDLIKDMCDSTATTVTASGTGSTTAVVDTSVSDFTVTSKGITNGTGTATITVNADKTKTTGMRYAWSDSTTAPTSGWVELTAAELSTAKSSGLSLSIRKEPGSGSSNGKWYLHVIGSYDTTGATVYKNACIDFGTKSSPAAGSTPPALTVTVDNTNWAVSRTIAIQATGAEALKYRVSGRGEWETLGTNAASVTVTENGYYTFLLTAGEITITKTVQVERIDKDNPTASIGNPISGSVESPKAGEYTKLILPVTYGDAQSGVKTVQYAWTNSEAAPSLWTTLSAGMNTVTYVMDTITYTATENSPTAKYLHFKVTDSVGHTYTTCSAAYTVISQTVVDANTPTITITGAPTSWTNDMATLTWELEKYSGLNYEVILPDGRKAKAGAAQGEVWAMQNGTYTVKVRDLEYGGENTASVVVDKLDFTAPSVTVNGVAEDWMNSAQTLTLTAADTGSGVGEIRYKIVTTNEEIPEDGLTQLGTGGTITVNQDGEWYVYYKVYDQAGDAATGREANKTEGFAGPVRVDTTSPVIGALTYNYEPKNLWDWLIGKESLIITVPVTEEGSGADEITYTVTPEGGLTESKTAQIKNGSADITVSADFKGTISITCTDKAENTSPSVTVGTSGKGLIIEDNAPVISFGEYTVASGITVTVTDDKDNAISAGLASVTYKIGDNDEVSVQENFTESVKTEVSFTIKAEQIPTGGADIIVKAVDNAGNQTGQTVTIEKHNVTYDFGTNGGVSATKTSDVILSGDGIDLTPTAARSGWKFVGWNTDKDAETGLTSLTMGNGDVTLYAIYSRVLTLTCYSGSAGDKQTNTVTIYNNATEDSLTVPAAKPWEASGESYDFYRYVTGPNEFTGTAYGGNSTIFLSEDTTLYAIYRKTIKISYDANGGSGTDEQRVYQRAHVADTVTYQTDSFTLRNGTGFSCTGYSFNGWIEGSGTGDVIEPGTSVTPTGDITYYASWTEADYTVTLHTNGGSGGTDLTSYTYKTGAVLPTDQTKTGYTFGGWYDNADCTGTAVTGISATETGNKEYWAKWVDDIAPVIGTLTYNYEPKNLWQWLIGKESLIITVPVTEEGSGADEITYTVTPEGGSAQDKTADIKEGLAEITVSADFKGTISITCTDKAGNTSSGVTVGTSGKGLIIEDNGPEITFRVGGGDVPSGEYSAAPEITVAVKDDKDNAISAGLASVIYQIGDGAEVSVQQDFTESLKTEVSFTIKAEQIPLGGTDIIVKATDNVGNLSEKKLTIHVHTGTLVEAKAAACTEDGHNAYYTCSCGKWFSDSECTKEVTVQEVTIPATGHDYSGSYLYDAEEHWKVCSRCGVKDAKYSHIYENDRDTACNDCGCERTVKNPDTEEPEEDEPETPQFTDLPETPQPTELPEVKPETTPGTQDNRQPEEEGVQTISASTDNGKTTISGETVATGNVEGMTNTSTALNLGTGAVIVTVVCEEKEYTAGVADTVAVANAVLMPEQIQLVADGETIEIRIDVTDISDKVPPQEQEIIEGGIKAYQKELPGLTLGMYVDISMFIKIGAGGWNAVTATEEPIEVVIGIPEKLQSDGREYYVIRSHEGEYTLLADMDDNSNTITISTDMFSAYAIAYQQADGAKVNVRCGLCHICPTFLGICYFIWLAIIVVTLFIIWIVIRRNRKEQEEQEK